jgi:hypothetical protein
VALRLVDKDVRDSASCGPVPAATPALDAAFERIAEWPHLLHEQLRQLDESGRTTAYRRRTLAYEPPVVQTLHAEARGTFDFGTFGRFVSFDDLDRLPQNPVPFLLADEAPFLTPRGREVYHFAFEPDTTIAGAVVRVVAVRAIPRVGDDQPVRAARILVEAESEQIIGLRLHRSSSNILFGETSVLAISLARAGAAWVPERTYYRVALRAVLTATRHFSLERRYQLERDHDVLAASRMIG